MTKTRADELSTSAYAVLGLVAQKSCTGYELTHIAKRTLHFFWPKEESLLYAQPPRLAAAGLVRVETETIGRRRRKRYSITEDGRAAMRRWLARRTAPPSLELEPALRLLYANLGTLDDAHTSVDALRDWATQKMGAGLANLESYADGTAPFPERDHINIVIAQLLGRIYQAVLDWCDIATDEISRWSSTEEPGPGACTAELLAEALLQARAALNREVRAPTPQPKRRRATRRPGGGAPVRT